MNKRQRKMKRSQIPYQVSTSSIGEIINAKAENGDFMAKRVIFELMEGGDDSGRSSNFRSS